MSKTDRVPQFAAGLLAVLAGCQLLDGTGDLTFKSSGPTGSGGNDSTTGSNVTTGAAMGCMPTFDKGKATLGLLTVDGEILFDATLEVIAGAKWRLTIQPVDVCNGERGPATSAEAPDGVLDFTFPLIVVPVHLEAPKAAGTYRFKDVRLTSSMCEAEFICGSAKGIGIGASPSFAIQPTVTSASKFFFVACNKHKQPLNCSTGSGSGGSETGCTTSTPGSDSGGSSPGAGSGGGSSVGGSSSFAPWKIPAAGGDWE